MMLLAVYGTLRKGYRNHHFVKSQQFLGTDYVHCYGLTYDEKDDYPVGCFIGLPTDIKIFLYVELYEVEEEALRSIDIMEGHPIDYMRTPVYTITGRAVHMYHQDRALGLFDERILEKEREEKYRWKPRK